MALPVLTPSLFVSECRYKEGEATSLLQINYIRFMQKGGMKEVEVVLGKDQFGFRRGKGNKSEWDVGNNIRTNFGRRNLVLAS